MKNLADRSGNKKTGLGRGRPIKSTGPLTDIGSLPEGGVLSQRGNSCGTCSLAAILRHYGFDLSQEDVDREIRKANIFTSPHLMIRFARDRGLEAVFKNRGGVSELKALLDREIPVILFIDTRPDKPYDPRHFHYVTALAYRENDGFHLGIYNPWGLREEITGEELSIIWDEVRFGPMVFYENAYMAIAPGGTELGNDSSSGVRGANMLGLAIANIVNGAVRILKDRILATGAFEIASGIVQIPVGLAIFAFEQVSKLVIR